MRSTAILFISFTSLIPGHPAVAVGQCVAPPLPPQPSRLSEIVAQIRRDHLRYVFIGERHGIGPVKRFAVELANALAADGTGVALYVEGFRSGCEPADTACWSLARTFNSAAYDDLLAESRVAVHPLDPPGDEMRISRMAETLAGGSEAVRVVLVGKTHVVRSDGDWIVFGRLRYPSPGDLAAAFPRDDSLTIGLEVGEHADAPYDLERDGCAFDYVLRAPDRSDYWSGAEGKSVGGGIGSETLAAPE